MEYHNRVNSAMLTGKGTFLAPRTSAIWRRLYNRPPTYFNNAGTTNTQATATPYYMPPHLAKTNGIRKPFLEFAMIISVIALSFFAVDNYRVRIGLQSKLQENNLQTQKAQEFYTKQMNALRKKRELQILNERKNVQMREMKMSLHVAMLRKQLRDHGIEPATIDEALQEYERSVKMENSISNVSGTSLWVVDDSPTKAFVPNVREYDSKKDGSSS